MANLNKVMLIGRLTRDPEVKTFANGGKVAAAARALGLHRNQLRRLIDKHGIAVDPDDANEANEE